MDKHSCFDCPCWECWETDGFSSSRCGDCPHSQCPVDQGIADDCAKRLHVKLESGDVKQLTDSPTFDPLTWTRPVPGKTWSLDEHVYLIGELQKGRKVKDIADIMLRRVGDIENHITNNKIPRGREPKMEWCILCARKVPWKEYDRKAGFCKACVQHRHNEEQNIALDIEEYELRSEREGRENNRLKQARKRMREPFQANPRKYR